ncbi:hypothetical protein WICMUC_000554 [Wickerhamomyces mucosus]|uniref:Ceramide glucosyltransferase n=1 Tax=Wickerhamomyces mucosus TaxID=1378264 RepID=A0A9P8PXD5_9ASCO|nr:hypothetical protein WICMUC_000554 [Wickerhamomyces mucosus]
MTIITIIGFIEIRYNLSGIKRKPIQISIDQDGNVQDEELLEGVTILRPMKGIDPDLEKCLESCLLQNYPRHKFQVLFCVEDPNDESVSIARKIIDKYKDIDCELLIDSANYGPNPKINNLAKGYQRAKYDIVWVLDSNVWVNPGTLVRSVVSLKKSLNNGQLTTDKPVGLIHHVPIVINENDDCPLGAKLDEMFLLTSHAKFYCFFNRIMVEPCVNGKSNLYRRSDIDQSVSKISKGEISLTKQDNSLDASNFIKKGEGLRFFSRYIGEDNMIGIGLWLNNGRQAMTGDVCIQPMTNNVKYSINDYVRRRVRWLRVRKYMVLAATLVEPTTESIFIGILGSYGISTLFLTGKYFWLLFIIHEIYWCFIDYIQYSTIIKFANVDELSKMSNSIKINKDLEITKWLPIWILREFLAFPIWVIAMCGGTIDWRNKPFNIKSDLSAEEL